MIVHRIEPADREGAAFLVADEATRTAALINPRALSEPLSEARRLGLDVRHVFLTRPPRAKRLGWLDLARLGDAALYMSHRADVGFDFTPIRGGCSLRFGTVRLRFAELGAEPSMAAFVYDLTQDGDDPVLVVLGDPELSALPAGEAPRGE